MWCVVDGATLSFLRHMRCHFELAHHLHKYLWVPTVLFGLVLADVAPVAMQGIARAVPGIVAMNSLPPEDSGQDL